MEIEKPSLKNSNKMSSYFNLRRLGVFIFILLLVSSAVLIFNSTQSLSAKCGKISSQPIKSVQAADSDKRLATKKKAYNKLLSYEKKCGIIHENDSVAELRSKTQYFHARATFGYDLLKRQQAKSDAEKGLAVYAMLPESDKAKYKILAEELEYVKDGQY